MHLYIIIIKPFAHICIFVHTGVNINSKCKEDDFTDSNADVNSLDVCVNRIHFRHEAHHTCNLRSSPLYTSRYSVSYKPSRHSQLHLNPGSFMMMMQILSATHLLIRPTNMKLYITPHDSFRLMMQILN